MPDNLEILKKYLHNSEDFMSAYGKHHLLQGDFSNIEAPMNSGIFVKSTKATKIKEYLSLIPQLLIYKNEMFQNEYIKKYKKICKSQSRWFNLELIIQAIILKKLSDKNILTGDVCTIGDGKAHFVFGVLDNPNINKIYTVNLPQALIQDYLILKKFKSIEEKYIKIVENEKDLDDEKCKLFFIPVQNKDFLFNKNIKLFVNSFSFQEMPLIETKKYVDIAISNNAFLYSLNNEEKTMYDGTKINYYDYGLQKKGKILFEEEAKFVKYYYNSKFPFIHKKKGKIISTLAKF